VKPYIVLHFSLARVGKGTPLRLGLLGTYSCPLTLFLLSLSGSVSSHENPETDDG